MPTIQNKLNSFAFSLICFAFVSCDLEIPEQSYNDALDLDHNADKGIFPPAFVFSPDDISISAGSNQSVAIYALEVDSIGGAHIQVNYDKNKVQINSITRGEWLVNQNQQPIFFVEQNIDAGIIDIYYSVLGSDEATSGSGIAAYILFSPLSPGTSTLKITNTTNAVTKNNQQIQLNGLGSLIVNAQ